MTVARDIVWRDGRFCSAEAAALSIRDRGVLIGDGAFETMIAINGAPAFWREHLARLNAGLDVLRIPSFAAEPFPSIVARLHQENQIVNERTVIRVTVTRGVGARGLAGINVVGSPTRLVEISAAPPSARAPARLMVTTRQRNTLSAFSRFKALSGYGENQLARFDAEAAGFDDGLLVNERGAVACASVANVFFFLEGDVLATPSADEGALPGVVRARVLSIAAKIGVCVAERSVSPDEIRGRWAMLANSVLGVAPASVGPFPQSPAPALIARIGALYDAEERRSAEQGRNGR
ncbi:MAG: aminotransferase class IV [Pseudomonadota bacterium]